MPRKRKMYVVGFDADPCRLWGADKRNAEYTYPMTYREAQQREKAIREPNRSYRRTIYKLVPVRTKKEK